MFFLIMFCIALSLSYFLLWLIYRKAFKSKKKVSKFLVFLGSIGLIIFYYTPPYSFYLEPSYWQFRNMCKLNELPNDEEKYNKILRYFDTDLDSLDWEELNEGTWQLKENSGDYKKGVFEYAYISKSREINYRLRIAAGFYSNKSKINRYNINAMNMYSTWHTNRYILQTKSMASYELEWREEKLICADVVKKNMIPKGENNE